MVTLYNAALVISINLLAEDDYTEHLVHTTGKTIKYSIYLTLYGIMDPSFWFNMISMGQSLVYFKGSHVEFPEL